MTIVRARRLSPPGTPSLLLFGAMSLLLHAGVWAVFPAASETFHPATETLAGETLDLEQSPPAAPLEEPADTTPTVSPDELPEAPLTRPSVRSARRPVAVAPAAGSASAALPPTPFGAAGVRYASDLATTFTRSFPQAASSDAVWANAPLGAAGVATVSLVIDDDGHLLSTAVLGSPSAALRKGIDRTLVLLGPRTFTASAAITRLRVSARVTRDDVHDGLHGDVFALSGGSFAGEVGSAFFTLPGGAAGGRRVDVEVRLLP